MSTILLVEDDVSVRTALTQTLSSAGFGVLAVDTAAGALRSVASEHLDLVVLDLGLPDLDGADTLRMIRGVSSVPVIVATARRGEDSIVRLLETGADDYLVKPFSGSHLIARIRALLRRSAPGRVDNEILDLGALHINVGERTASLADDPLDLSRRQFDLLTCLARNVGKVVTRRTLLEDVWQDSERGNDQTIDVHVAWLRRKLGETAASPRYLHTVRGVGLKLTVPT
jgi:DNA-binding response OmpR family regulator